MNAIKKFLIGFFLILGVPLSLLMIFSLFDTTATKEDRDGAIAALFLFGLPPTGIATYLIFDLKSSQKNNTNQKQTNKEQIFLELLASNNGEITALKFALESKLPLANAQEYLDSKARELNADFSVNDEGNITYKFYV